MSYRVLIAKVAWEDLERQFDFLAEKDFAAALRARAAIEKGYALLGHALCQSQGG